MGRDVFINCPFDVQYARLLEALLFAVHCCRFKPRCALEAADSGEVRIHKIYGIIRDCDFGVHDISRTELNNNDLPRFNMPFELGLFLGAREFGTDRQQPRSCIVLDIHQYRYQQFLSDIAGQDIQAHGDDPHRLITVVRNWLNTCVDEILPGGRRISRHYDVFQDELPAMLDNLPIEIDELTYADQTLIIEQWLSLYPV